MKIFGSKITHYMVNATLRQYLNCHSNMDLQVQHKTRGTPGVNGNRIATCHVCMDYVTLVNRPLFYSFVVIHRYTGSHMMEQKVLLYRNKLCN